MKNKTLILIAVFLSSFTIVFSQDVKSEANKVETKIDLFSSRTGVIKKFVDYKLPAIKSFTMELVESRIRVVTIGSESSYFYQIDKYGKYGNKVASIEYTDLLEVIKALESLKSQIDADIAINPDYLENKFTTVDGFQVGYYVSQGKSKWFLMLEKYGSDNTIIINDAATVENAFIEAKNKIEAIKK
jgi:hypothetical protein